MTLDKIVELVLGTSERLQVVSSQPIEQNYSCGLPIKKYKHMN